MIPILYVYIIDLLELQLDYVCVYAFVYLLMQGYSIVCGELKSDPADNGIFISYFYVEIQPTYVLYSSFLVYSAPYVGA